MYLRSEKGALASITEKGGKYYEEFMQYIPFLNTLIDLMKDVFGKKFSWTPYYIMKLIQACYAVYQIVWALSKGLPVDKRKKFIVACMEYVVEEGVGQDVPDWVWDLVYAALEKFIPLAVKVFGENLESNSPVTFDDVQVYKAA